MSVALIPRLPEPLSKQQPVLLFYNHILFWIKNNIAQSNHPFAQIWANFKNQSILNKDDDLLLSVLSKD